MTLSKKNGIAVALVSLLVGFGLFTFQIKSAPKQRPPERAPLYYYIAVDNSISYGMTKAGKRILNTQEVFDRAKDALNRQLRERGMFLEGDHIVGMSPFTDEPTLTLENYLTGGPVEARLDNLPTISTVIEDALDKIHLRPKPSRGDYKTTYRNVLDYADREFSKWGATPDQQVGIVLTDERGDEVGGTAELPLEEYSKFYVIKLAAQAGGKGVLMITTNKKLAQVANQENAPVLTYVASIRDRYKALHPVTDEKPVVTVVVYFLIFVIPIFGYVVLVKSHDRTVLLRRRSPQLRASYNPGVGKIILQAEQFKLPSERDKYWLDEGTELKNPSPETGSIEPAESLLPGSYEITVQPDSGPPVKTSFTVSPSSKAEPSLRATYKASSRMIFLNAHDCELPTGGQRYEVDEGIGVEHVNPEAGEVILLRPLQAGSHKITVHLENAAKVEAAFEAGPPPPPTPKYSVSVARYSDMGNTTTVELTEREINLLDSEKLRASVWVKRDEHYLNIRTVGNVQKQDGTPILGNLQVALGSAVNNPIFLALEDDGDDIEITVQKS